MVRSILAVVAGYLVMFLGVSLFFVFAMAVGFGEMPRDPAAFQPPAWLYVAEVVFGTLAALGGGYVCVWVARRRQQRHLLVLAAVIVVLGVVSAFAESGLKPLWSSIAVVVTGALGAVAGGWLRMRQENALPPGVTSR